MTFDPKTALADCDTLLLDMDGTILDLAYDNYMWLQHVPGRWAEQNGMTLQDAQKYLFSKFGEAQGDLRWYCLDHWSEHLGLDVAQLHRENHHLIDYLPGAKEFLEAMRAADIRVIMATNSHQATLDLKHEVTGLCEFFDGIYTSHSFGFAKERQEFWRALQEEVAFDPVTTMFVDDSHPVLASAKTYGVAHPVAINLPDTSRPPREDGDYVSITGLSDLV